MRKAAENSGYMTLKVELMQTKIARTIVVPEHMTLEDLNDAIQAVMGWCDAHLWQFTDKSRVQGIKGGVDMSRFMFGHTIEDILYRK